MSQAAADLREPDRASCASRAAAGMVVGMGSIEPPALGGMRVALKLVHIRSSEGRQLSLELEPRGEENGFSISHGSKSGRETSADASRPSGSTSSRA